MRANFIKQKYTNTTSNPGGSKPIPKTRLDKSKPITNQFEEHKEVPTLSARLNFNCSKERERQTMEEIKVDRQTDTLDTVSQFSVKTEFCASKENFFNDKRENLNGNTDSVVISSIHK